MKAIRVLSKRVYWRLCWPLINMRFIIDDGKKLGNFKLGNIAYDVSLKKEQLSRKFIFEMPGTNLNFLDIGARDGKLDYLLGIKENLLFDQHFYEKNREVFFKKFNYYGLDLSTDRCTNMICGDICSEEFIEDNPKFINYFDVIYSNNVFEHLRKPWIACSNLTRMLKSNGICITISSFSARYHECPSDYFRYTHRGLVALFEDSANVRTMVCGYDISGRRNNWQGSGETNDLCPVDHFGAWRENWFVVVVIRKTA